MERIERFQRYLWSVVAGTCLGGGVLLVAWAGLPQHHAFTGLYVEGYGYVAPEVGSLAPPFRGMMLDGAEFALEDWTGRLIVLNFWATWCEPCKIEMPELMEVAEARPDVLILGINTGEPVGHVRAWLAQEGIDLPILMDGDGRISAMYRLRGQPMSYIIGRDGRIERIFFGAVDARTLLAVLS